jgi:hypothetical protein
LGKSITWSKPIKSRLGRSYPDGNQPIIVKFASQGSPGRNDQLAVEFYQRHDAFRHGFFNAATGAHWMYGTHWVNLADMKTSRGSFT